MLAASRVAARGGHQVRVVSRRVSGQQQRSLKIFQAFSKEARAERKKQLAEEINRGYFDDLREFREQGGCVFPPSAKLISTSQARRFPALKCVKASGERTDFPNEGGLDLSVRREPGATLVVAAIRNGSQGVLESWSLPFSAKFQNNPNVSVIELSLVDSVVMSIWPFRSMLLRSSSENASKYNGTVQHLTNFENRADVKKTLGMTNIYAGYVYLLDERARIRWKASGPPGDADVDSLLKSASCLIDRA